MENVVIIGAGAAGLTAAVYAARANLAPLVIEGMQPGGQLTTTTEVENFPGFPDGIDGTELMDKFKAQAERFGAKFLQYDAVQKADFSKRPFKLEMMAGDPIEAKTVIIATGATAKYLGIESEQKFMGRGVSACATCDGAFYKDVPIVVVGGGDTACEEAMFLTRFASKVTLVHRRDELRASKIMADRTVNHSKIEMAWNSTIEEILGDDTGVTGVRIKNVKTGETTDIEAKGYFSAIGHKPNTDAFKQLDMDEVGYLIADGVKTKYEGVYAAGDVSDAIYRQAVSAAGTGCAAALEAERFLEAQGE
ncbi:thioredoxin-disulfide reductase [Pontiella sulfatireligans]|uniref:Thioredoxin reductase n=1 Tax=Pontiella sulfatireligans TaxID=2750658 RepID=A0A6C2UPM0_9BACT|nr:thioredoxin-disulfide reductase [Pontiella sulfatireligans]VGO20956.1 Thioredoxin reductase [Pontiella sulfatireligans]